MGCAGSGGQKGAPENVTVTEPTFHFQSPALQTSVSVCSQVPPQADQPQELYKPVCRLQMGRAVHWSNDQRDFTTKSGHGVRHNESLVHMGTSAEYKQSYDNYNANKLQEYGVHIQVCRECDVTVGGAHNARLRGHASENADGITCRVPITISVGSFKPGDTTFRNIKVPEPENRNFVFRKIESKTTDLIMTPYTDNKSWATDRESLVYAWRSDDDIDALEPKSILCKYERTTQVYHDNVVDILAPIEGQTKKGYLTKGGQKYVRVRFAQVPTDASGHRQEKEMWINYGNLK